MMKRYESYISILRYQLDLLHQNLAAMKKLEDFKEDLFLQRDEVNMRNGIFLYLSWFNLAHYSAITINKIWNDKTKNSITLKKARELLENRDSGYKEDTKKKFDAVDEEEKRINGTLKNVEYRRNKFFAHLDKKAHFNPPPKEEHELYLQDLVKVKAFLTRYFNILVSKPETFDTSAVENNLEYILDLVSLDSEIITSYHDRALRPQWQKKYRSELNPADLQLLNTLLRKHGRKPIT